MEDADPGVPDLCRTEHSGPAQPGEQAGQESGSDSPSLGAKPFEGPFSFFNRSQADPSHLHRATV